MELPKSLELFLFRPVSATGFRLMTRAWALVTFGTFLMQFQDNAFYYSNVGIMPLDPDVMQLSSWFRFSLFSVVTSPRAIVAFYLVLLFALVCVFCGLQKRIALVVAVFLIHSFFQRNPLPIGGGDVVLYNIGFLLMVSSLLIDNQSKHTIPIWPYRLLLFQVIAIYVYSAWSKLLGGSWLDGSAIEMVLLNAHFSRWPEIGSSAIIQALSPWLSYATIAWELLWLLLLIPMWKHHTTLLRILIISGVFFHLGILVFLKVGSFSVAMMVAYIGIYFCSRGPQ